MNSSAKMDQIEVLRIELAVLRQEHRDLGRCDYGPARQASCGCFGHQTAQETETRA
jgi:hypothetical protein